MLRQMLAVKEKWVTTYDPQEKFLPEKRKEKTKISSHKKREEKKAATGKLSK